MIPDSRLGSPSSPYIFHTTYQLVMLPSNAGANIIGNAKILVSYACYLPAERGATSRPRSQPVVHHWITVSTCICVNVGHMDVCMYYFDHASYGFIRINPLRC